MVKYGKMTRSPRRFVGVINPPNWLIMTLRELINFEKLPIGWQMYSFFSPILDFIY